MATNGLGCLIMTAVIDQRFRERLVAAPAEAMQDFELTDDEQRAVTSIRAGSFVEFADQLQRWLEQQREAFYNRTREHHGTGEHSEVSGSGSSFGEAAPASHSVHGRTQKQPTHSSPLYLKVDPALNTRYVGREDASKEETDEAADMPARPYMHEFA